MERYYTILLDRRGRFPARHLPGKSGFDQPLDLASALADPPRPAVHRERLTPQEVQELAEEPEFVAAAEIMKTRLLSPVSEGGPSPSAPPDGRPRHPWGLAAVGADRSKFTGAGVAVALLDTGIDAGHQAFRGVDLVEKDFTGSGNGDREGHGTHCAGILFGRNVDGVRIGVAPGIRRALIGKIIGPHGGDSDMMVRGLCWAHEEGARVISMSVGFDLASTMDERVADGLPRELALSATFEACRGNLRLLDCLLQMLRMQEPMTGGAIIISAAGNDSSRGPNGEFVMSAAPPAGSDKIVSVGSLDRDANGAGYRVSSFSNSGVEIVAPGRGIVSAQTGGGLKVLSGTSVAAPHVAGVAALWWQAVRQSDLPANATLVRAKLLAGVESRGFSASAFPAEHGAGRAMAPQDGMAVSSRRPALRAPRGERPYVGEVALRADVARRFTPGSRLEPIAVGAGSERSALSRQRRLC